MQLINATSMIAGYTQGLEPSGRELLVVVVKGTFNIPRDGKPPDLAPKQEPLVMADTFTGEPGRSAPVYEADFPPRKPKCDVLLNGSAYAPGGRPATRVPVRLRVGSIDKSFVVVGHRAWEKDMLGVSDGGPSPFTKMPISYDNAFGGVDELNEDPQKHRWYPSNHAGRGYFVSPADLVHGKPLPNTEEHGNPVRKPNGKYRPMSFGPIGRAWDPRYKLAGTYDQNWIDNVFPFLPSDFQDAYYQFAPEDQQMEYPKGGERIELTNLSPAGDIAFNLPSISIPVEFSFKHDPRKKGPATLDTIIIEPDLNRFLVCWRAMTPLKKNMFDVPQVVVGDMPPGWYRARDLGKTYYRSLKELVAARDEN